MEQLQYVIEDSTIAELLGVQNFTNDESAILELVKNAYDAKAPSVTLEFMANGLTITDTGEGMSAEDIRQHWMHVGKSPKDYEVIDGNGHKRILAGAKGVGRFALARLGRKVQVRTKKASQPGVIWETDWSGSMLREDSSITAQGTEIIISDLREKWTKKKVTGLKTFLSKTYNATEMEICISHPEVSFTVERYFSNPVLGKDYLSRINISYDCKNQVLTTKVVSDEFSEEAKKYCPSVDISKFDATSYMVDELKSSSEWELDEDELQARLRELGDFSGEFYFSIKPTKVDMERKDKEDVESRYKYDVRILNVLATIGLKAASIAHELENNRNSIAENIDNIIAALKEYGLWEEISSPERTEKVYKNIPYLLESNRTVSTKIITFMNVMLSEIEKRQFEPSWQSVVDVLKKIIPLNT